MDGRSSVIVTQDNGAIQGTRKSTNSILLPAIWTAVNVVDDYFQFAATICAAGFAGFMYGENKTRESDQ